MAKILFASNNIVHFPGASSSSLAGTYDSTRVPYSIAVPNLFEVEGPFFTPSDTEDTWFHTQFYAQSDGNDGGMLFAAYDSSNRLLFTLNQPGFRSNRILDATLFNGNTTTTVTSSIAFNPATRNTFDIHYKTNILGIELRFYLNGALCITIIFGTNPNAYGKPVRARYGHIGNTAYFSEVFFSNSDTRNGRLNFLRPLASGAYNDWSGSLLSLIDEDLTTGLSALEPALKHSVLISPYTGAEAISNIAIVSNTIKGENAPTKLKHLIRKSAVDYVSADLNISSTLQYNLTDNETNPATSLPWVSSDLSGIEVGFISVA